MATHSCEKTWRSAAAVALPPMRSGARYALSCAALAVEVSAHKGATGMSSALRQLALECDALRQHPAATGPEPGTQLDHLDLRIAAVRTRQKATRNARLHSIWKLQLPLNRVIARLLAQRGHERVDFQRRQTRIAQAQCRLEPAQCPRHITPLRLDFGGLKRTGVAIPRLHGREHGFCVGMPPELLVRQRQAHLYVVSLPLLPARGPASHDARAL